MWKRRMKIAAFALVCLTAGYLLGRVKASIQTYAIGFANGYHSGVSDAATTYESGGKIMGFDKSGKIVTEIGK